MILLVLRCGLIYEGTDRKAQILEDLVLSEIGPEGSISKGSFILRSTVT